MGQSQSGILREVDVMRADDIPQEVYVMTQDEENAVLYKALKKEKTSEVVRLCQQRHIYRDGPMHVLTIHGDTVLHMAAYTVQADLVIALLGMLNEEECSKLTCQNAAGNTILHEAAAFNKLVPAAKKMLELAPHGQLLGMRNLSGETALFRAACYGKIDMFAFLDMQVRENSPTEEERKAFYKRATNNTTVLHTAVTSGHFELALRISKRYCFLVDERDQDDMTALQHLARNSLAFMGKNAGWLKRLIHKCVPDESDRGYRQQREGHVARGWRVPLWEEIQEEKQRYELAKELAKFLVKKDPTSWKKTNPVSGKQASQIAEVETQNDGRGPSSAPIERKINPETPLFLATKAGCVDIVKQILKLYPQAVEYVDDDGCTLLHVSLKYRQIEIFKMVEKGKSSIRKLIQKTNSQGNSILHMVAEKAEYKIEQMKLTKEKDNNSDSNQVKDGDDKKRSS